jgi:hypothetical protein
MDHATGRLLLRLVGIPLFNVHIVIDFFLLPLWVSIRNMA